MADVVATEVESVGAAAVGERTEGVAMAGVVEKCATTEAVADWAGTGAAEAGGAIVDEWASAATVTCAVVLVGALEGAAREGAEVGAGCVTRCSSRSADDSVDCAPVAGRADAAVSSAAMEFVGEAISGHTPGLAAACVAKRGVVVAGTADCELPAWLPVAPCAGGAAAIGVIDDGEPVNCC